MSDTIKAVDAAVVAEDDREPQHNVNVLRRIVGSRLFFPIICLVLVLLINLVVSVFKGDSPTTFFRITLVNGQLTGPLIVILNYSAELVILAVGMTVVVSCSSGVDISVGAVMALSSGVLVRLLGFGSSDSWRTNNFHVVSYVVPLAFAILAGVVVGALCGAWNGFLVSKLRIQPMVATLILYGAARGAARVVTFGQMLRVDPPSFQWFGTTLTNSAGNSLIPIPMPTLIAVVFVIIVALVLRFTALGMNVQSVGINNKASRIVGLNSSRIILLAFVFCGVCAAIAGLIASSRLATVDPTNEGHLIEMDAILAVALGGNSLMGGKFSLAGSVIGAITVQTLSTVILSINVSADQLPLFKAIIVIIIVALQSTELRPLLRRVSATISGWFGMARSMRFVKAGEPA